MENKADMRGFTIVELLIVIIVIGILAAITLVSFNGIKAKAVEAAIKSDIEHSIKNIELAKETAGSTTYPLEATNLLVQSGDNITTYTQKPYGFCISGKNGTQAYAYKSGSAATTAGDCTVKTSILAGPTDGATGYVDGKGSEARLQGDVRGMAFASNGDLYFSDTLNRRIRKVTPEGVVTTIAGNGISSIVDGDRSTASFNSVQGIAEKDGYLYAIDNSHVLRKVSIDTGEVSTVVGRDSVCNNSRTRYADGPASTAQLDYAANITLGTDGLIYFTATMANRIRTATLDGTLSTYAGAGDILACAKSGESGFADGDRLEARFNAPSGITTGPDGSLFVVDYGNYAIRKITKEGIVSTVTKPVVNGYPVQPRLAVIARSGTVYFSASSYFYTVDTQGTVSRLVLPANTPKGTPRFIALNPDNTKLYVAVTNMGIIYQIEL